MEHREALPKWVILQHWRSLSIAKSIFEQLKMAYVSQLYDGNMSDVNQGGDREWEREREEERRGEEGKGKGMEERLWMSKEVSILGTISLPGDHLIRVTLLHSEVHVGVSENAKWARLFVMCLLK